MSASYEEKFNVLEVFEENLYQKIVMGTKKVNPEDVVVINIFKKNEFLNSKFVSDLFSSLRFLAFFEETESEISIATDYYEGMSLTNYIEGNNLTFQNRKDLALEYLEGLKNYDSFDLYFLKLFSQDKQLIISNGELKFTEIIVIDDLIEKPHNFKNVISTVGRTLDRILFFKFDSILSNSSLQDYIDSLISNSITLNSIDEIELSLKNILNDITEILEEANESPIIPVLVPILDADINQEGKVSDFINKDVESDSLESEIEPISNVEIEPEKLLTEEVVSVAVETIDDLEPLIEETLISEETSTIEEIPISEILERNTERVIELENLTFSNSDLNEILDEPKERDNKKPNSLMWIFLIALIAIIGLFGKFVFFKSSSEPPIASFERIKEYEKIVFKNTSKAFGNNNEITLSQWIVTSNGNELLNTTDNYDLELKFKNSDTYKVSLKVQDKNGVWSETYFEEFDYEVDTLESLGENAEGDGDESNEKLNKYSIKLGENGLFSNDIKRSGSKSIELDLASNDGQGEIVLDGIFLDNDYIISLWIMADSNEPIKLEFTGYNNDSIKFVKSTTHNPTSGNIWDMVEIGGGNNLIDKLHIKVTSNNKTVWIDDIELNSYK